MAVYQSERAQLFHRVKIVERKDKAGTKRIRCQTGWREQGLHKCLCALAEGVVSG
jgi:hypothetical protein